MNPLLAIFILGCCVSAFSALGLVFAAGALNEGTMGGFEGKARNSSETVSEE